MNGYFFVRPPILILRMYDVEATKRFYVEYRASRSTGKKEREIAAG